MNQRFKNEKFPGLFGNSINDHLAFVNLFFLAIDICISLFLSIKSFILLFIYISNDLLLSLLRFIISRHNHVPPVCLVSCDDNQSKENFSSYAISILASTILLVSSCSFSSIYTTNKIKNKSKVVYMNSYTHFFSLLNVYLFMYILIINIFFFCIAFIIIYHIELIKKKRREKKILK
jgi:hypothetical protein